MDVTGPTLVGTLNNKSIDCEKVVVFDTPQFTDNCGQPTVTSTDIIPTGNSCPKAYVRTWTVTDACNNSSTFSQTITVLCCPSYCTYTQGFYGNKGGKACTPSGTLVSAFTIMNNAINAAGGSKVFGIDNSQFRYFKLVSADITSDNIFNMLPGGSTPRAIDAGTSFTSYANTSTWSRIILSSNSTTYGKIRNNLLSQTMTLFFNLSLNNGGLGSFELLSSGIITSPKVSCISPLPLAQKDTFYIPQNIVTYLTNNGNATVQGLFNLANQYLGGFTASGINISSVNKAVDAINNGFDNCRVFRGYYTPVTSYALIAATKQGVIEDKAILSPTVKDAKANIPEPVELKATAHPNPFNSFVEINFDSPIEGKVLLEVYTVLGQKVYTDSKVIFGKGASKSGKFSITNVLPKTPLIYKLSVGNYNTLGKLFPQGN